VVDEQEARDPSFQGNACACMKHDNAQVRHQGDR
jgi:hypothetical protein